MRDLALIHDIRYAARNLRYSPIFTTIAILSLALGIGITSAVFSVADALLLRPLPVPRASEIATISSTAPGARADAGSVSYPDYADLRNQNKSFQGLIAFAYFRAGMAGNPAALPQVKGVLAVSGNYFCDFQVEPALGRGFSSEEDRVPGRNAVAVLSYTTWEQHFSADPKVIGRTIRLNDREFTIIGVAPETFVGTEPFIHPDLYIPIMMLPEVSAWGQSAISQRDLRMFTVKGRLKRVTSIAQSAAEMDTLGRGLADAYPVTNRNRRLLVRTELQARAAQAPQRLALSAMLLGIAGLVLMVACANVASLLLAKLGVRYLSSVVSFSTDLPQYVSFRLDQRVLVFNFVVAVMSALVFGLAPAIRSAGTDLVPALKTGEGSSSSGRTMLRSALVVGQIALALILLSGEALFIRTFQSMAFANPGFRTDHLVMMSFDPSLVRYTPGQTSKFYHTLIERARQLPGVNHAALSRMTPTQFIPPSASVAPEGFQFPPDRESDLVYTYTVGDQYFETIGTPLASGRGFRAMDDSTSPHVAVINEVFAQKYWPGLNPVGKRFRLGDRSGPWVEVVGVAKTTWYAYVGEDRAPFFYLPMAQNPQVAMTLMVETATPDAAAAIGPLRDLVHSIDGRQPVFNVRTMHEYYQRQALQTLRTVVQLVGTMGVLGFSLALIGIYALVAYSVSRRTREIGIRMAIGAGRLDILRLVLGQGVMLALIGAGLGLAGSFGLVCGIRALFTRLQERGIFDAWTFVAVPLALIVVTIVATYIPARCAAAIDPNRVLRYE